MQLMKLESTTLLATLNSHRNDPTACFALSPLKLLSLINEQSYPEPKAIRREYTEFVKAMSKFASSRVNKDVHSYAIALISLLDSTAHDTVLKCLDFTVRLRVKFVPLDEELLSVADFLIHWYAQNGYIPVCGELVSNLIQKSEIENTANIMRHRSLVTAALSILVDLDRVKTIEICKQQEHFFMRSSGIHAAQFYWFYAFSLYVTGHSELARPKLKKCNELYLDAEGKHSWIGALAMVFYHYIGLESSDFYISENYLWDFLKKMDQNFFDVDAHDAQKEELRIHTRYVLLRQHMEKQTLRSLFPEICRYRKECVQHQHKTKNPRLTVRTAENLLCAYYFEIGDYLNAVHHAMVSLETVPPSNLTPIPAEDTLYATLLQLFNTMNDGQQIIKYIECLCDALTTAEIDEEYYRKRLLVHTSQVKMGIPMDSIINEYRRDINARCQLMNKGHTEDLDKWGISIAYWYVAMLSVTNNLKRLDASELRHCEQLLHYFLDHPVLFPFNNIQLVFVYLELARIEWALQKDSAVSTMQISLRYCRHAVISNDVKVTVLRAAAELFFAHSHVSGVSSLLISTSEEMMFSITNAWQSATRYLNDHRLSQLLVSVQSEFDRCYALIRDRSTIALRYEYILRFKNLASLVGRERNRILQTTFIDESLKSSIHRLQDQLAAAELDDTRQGTNKATAIHEKLLHMEAEFAKAFPHTTSWNAINCDKILSKLSEGEAVIEYYFAQHPRADDLTGLTNIDLEIFVSTKVNGHGQLHHALIPNGYQILDWTNEFTNILQNPGDSVSRSGDKAALRAELYRHLLAPVLPHLIGIKTIYIAPDGELFNLPFEILYADGSGILQERFGVCRIVSGRDILYFNDNPVINAGAFLLGDPDYGPEETLSPENKREISEVSTVRELPFSGVEVARISKYFDGSFCTREKATKYALSQAGPRRVIHLATHGSFDKTMESNALYSSCLIFSGYNNWARGSKKIAGSENGILTADEISRMNLAGTELVVLSACLSGMGDISYGTMQGLISAFSAAGVRWVVSHVWKANDFTTPILMDAFYDSYLNKHLTVPDALQYAKHYLSTVTVGELRNNGWFNPPADYRLSADEKAYLERCSKSIDRRKLFQDELYWGGFVAYRCQ